MNIKGIGEDNEELNKDSILCSYLDEDTDQILANGCEVLDLNSLGNGVKEATCQCNHMTKFLISCYIDE